MKNKDSQKLKVKIQSNFNLPTKAGTILQRKKRTMWVAVAKSPDYCDSVLHTKMENLSGYWVRNTNIVSWLSLLYALGLIFLIHTMNTGFLSLALSHVKVNFTFCSWIWALTTRYSADGGFWLTTSSSVSLSQLSRGSSASWNFPQCNRASCNWAIRSAT